MNLGLEFGCVYFWRNMCNLILMSRKKLINLIKWYFIIFGSKMIVFFYIIKNINYFYCYIFLKIVNINN